MSDGTRPTWHLAPGHDFACSECSGEVEVMIVPGRVVATCRRCEASREFELSDGYFDRERVPQTQFVNLIPRLNVRELLKYEAEVMKIADEIEFVDEEPSHDNED